MNLESKKSNDEGFQHYEEKARKNSSNNRALVKKGETVKNVYQRQ